MAAMLFKPGARRPVIVALAGALGLVGAAVVEAKTVTPDPKRIKQIAELLEKRPAVTGRPVSDRRAWAPVAKLPAFRAYVRRAEALLDKPVPELTDELFLQFSRTGNRTNYQRPFSRRRGNLKTLVLAECVQNTGRFLPAIAKYLKAVCAEKTWVLPAHDRDLRNFRQQEISIDLGSAQQAWDMATVDRLLGEKLPPSARKKLRAEVRRRVLGPYRKMVTSGQRLNWWIRCTNNWNAVCHAGVVGAALTMIDSPKDRAVYVAAAELHLRRFLAGFTDDGYCTEGLGYWNYGFGQYVLLAEVVHQATGGRVDLMELDGKIQRVARFPLKIEIAEGIYPAFADCSVGAGPAPHYMAWLDRRLGLGLGRWNIRSLAGAQGRLYEAVLLAFPNSATGAKPVGAKQTKRAPRSWFDAAGILICRAAAEGNLSAALKGGHNNEHHNHNDLGSFVVALHGRTPLLDPGSEVYTARTFSRRRYDSDVLNSFGHPVPRVAGRLQRAGRNARAKVLRADFTDRADTLVLDIASAYAVKTLQSLTRTFVFSRKGAGSLTVTDTVAFARPESFGTALVTLGDWKQVGKKTLEIRDGDAAVRVRIDAGGAEFRVEAARLTADVRTRRKPLRIGIDLARPAAGAAITMTITPAK